MKRTLRIVGIVFAVIVVAVIALPFGVDVNSFRPKLESELSSALARPVKVGKLTLSLLSATVAADDISIADDPAFSQNPFVQARSLKVGVEIWPLIFSRSLRVTNLTLQQPEIVLIHSATGTWNFSSLGGAAGSQSAATPAPSPATLPAQPAAPSGSPALLVRKFDIKNGRVSVTQASTGKTRVYANVNISGRDVSFTSQFPFILTADLSGGGTLSITGQAGPVSATDASMTPVQAQIQVKQLDLAASGIADFSPGLAGLANFDGTVSSDGQTVRTAGTLQAERLKLLQKGGPAGRPVTIKYALEHALHSQSGTVTAGDIAMGKAVAHLTGTYQNQGVSMLLNMKLNAQAMPVDDLQAMLPAVGVILPTGSRLQGGTLSATLSISGPANDPVIAGPIRLSNSKLAGFDLGSKLAAISKGSSGKTGVDTSIQNFSADARMGPDGIRSENINLTVPAFGALTGSGTISPAGQLEFKMTANLNGAVSTAVTHLAHFGNQGVEIPFFIRGTSAQPTFTPDVKGMLTKNLAGQLKSKLSGKSSASSGAKPSLIDKFKGLFHRKNKK